MAREELQQCCLAELMAIAAGVIEDRLPCGRPSPRRHYPDWASI